MKSSPNRLLRILLLIALLDGADVPPVVAFGGAGVPPGIILLPSLKPPGTGGSLLSGNAYTWKPRFGGTLKILGQGYSFPNNVLLGDWMEGFAEGQARLKGTGSPAQWLGYEVHVLLRGQTFSDDRLGSFSQFTRAETSLFRYADLESTWEKRTNAALLGEVAYANIRLSLPPVDVVIGRQAITFGRTFFWNPTDWLSPFSPNEIDREYKGGVDAVRASLSLGTASGFEAVAAFGKEGRRDESAFIGRVYTNLWGWDVEVLGGKVLDETRLGGGFSGDIGGAGFRGEGAWFRPKPSNAPPFFRGTLEADYQWPNSFHITGEVHYNGFGTGDVREYWLKLLSERVQTGQIQNVGRWYGGGQVSYDLTPLLNGGLVGMANVEDGSGLLGPIMTWSLSDEADFLAGGFLFWGSRPQRVFPRSEFGTYPHMVWFEIRWSF